jgi:hypothetical protein
MRASGSAHQKFRQMQTADANGDSPSMNSGATSSGVHKKKIRSAIFVFLTLIDNLHSNGYKVGNFSLTTDYLGGLFSLDGLHPSNTGYGIMANEFIKDINAAFHTQIPPADILRIAEHDPLILP